MQFKGTTDTLRIQCNRCGAWLPDLVTLDKKVALKALKEAGWMHLGEDEDYCPSCTAILHAAAGEQAHDRDSAKRPLFGSKIRHFLDVIGGRGCKATTETKE